MKKAIILAHIYDSYAHIYLDLNFILGNSVRPNIETTCSETTYYNKQGF